MNRRELPKHPLFQAQVTRDRVQKRQWREDSPGLPTQLPDYGDSHWSREGRGWTEGNTSFLDTTPQQRSPLVEKENLRRRYSQKAYSWSWPLGSHQPLAASGSFPNRSQVWARCPGRKWGRQGHAQAAFQAHCPHTRTGTVPAAGRGWEPPTLFPGLLTQKPLYGGSLQNQIPSLPLLGTWSPLDNSHCISTSALLPSPPCWKRMRRRGGRGGVKGGKGRKRSDQGRWQYPVRAGMRESCTVPQRPWVGEGDLRKLEEQGFSLPLSS